MHPFKPTKIVAFATAHGLRESYLAGQIFHAQDFPGKIFLLESGYVKRYQVNQLQRKVLELIYGPGHLISLSQLYKLLFGVDQNQDNSVYVYQAMTDIEMICVETDVVIEELKRDPGLYQDFFYESGLKLRSNILRLASNAMDDRYKKVAHQLVGLAYEFSDLSGEYSDNTVVLPLPQTPTDLAEQLNLPVAAVEEALKSFLIKKIISVKGSSITLLNVELLKDIYL